MKKIFTLIALLMMATWVGWGQKVWDGTADTDWYNGNPNATEFTINTAEELAGLAELVNEGKNFDGKTVKLGADIILNENSENYKEWETTAPEKEWTPIGTTYNGFSGTFDGCGHIISGLYINENENKTNNYYGLFAKTVGTITHVQVINSYIEANSYLGGIVGYIGNSGEITKCSFVGIIKAKLEDANNQSAPESRPLYCGGICGSQNSPNGIESCFFKGRIEAEINNCSDFSGKYIGGIVGYSMAGTIKDCYNEGTIAVSGSENSVTSISIGGIAGFPYSIYGCYNIGAVTVSVENNPQSANVLPPVSTGGIVGTANIGGVKYCYNTGEVLNQVQTGTNYKIGGIVGYTTSSATLEKNYVLSTDESTTTGITSATEEQFKSGEVAWNLRGPITIDDKTTILGFGQDLQDALITSPTLLAFTPGKEVYKLILKYPTNQTLEIYRNAIESNLLPQTTYEEIMEGAAEGQDLVWKNEAGDIFSGNTYKVTKDETLTGELKNVYNITAIVAPEEAGEITNLKTTAANDEKVSFSLGITDGYKLLSVTMNEETLVDENADGIYTFTMPAEDVTITATFEKIETGGDGEEGEGGIGTKRYQLFLADQDFYLNDEYDAEGLVLYSLHDKRYTKAGSSFTVWFEKNGEVNEGARVFISNRANGEYKEVKLDEVSGYYQIRNVQSNIYVKLYTEEGFPVANESIEATDARAYAQANKIVVITPEPTDVQIISMAGAVVASAQVAGQQEFANLAEGVYIVRMGNEILKLQVRN